LTNGQANAVYTLKTMLFEVHHDAQCMAEAVRISRDFLINFFKLN